MESARERTVLDYLLHPRSVAFIGASSNPETLGGRPIGFLTNYGFPGRIYPVNPSHPQIQGLQAYASILDVPEAVDVAMIAVRASLVPGVLRDCITAGVRVAVVMSSGFGEGMGAGAELRDEIEALVGTSPMRILGPNCEGVASLPAAAPLTFSPILDAAGSGIALRRGRVAVVSQSGGLGFAVMQWGSRAGVGFNYCISTGNELDLNAIEVANGLADDAETDAIVAVVEGFGEAADFGPLSDKLAAAGKKLIVAKMGRSAAGSRGALAHTTHDAGDTGTYRDLFARHGVLRADDEDQLIDLLQTAVKSRPMRGPRVGVMTTSGGAGVWLADACADFGLEVPLLSEALQQQLAAHMPGFGSPINPVDLTAQFIAGGNFSPSLDVLLSSPEVDAVILATSLASAGRLQRDRDGLAELLRKHDKPLAVYTYTNPAQSCVDILDELQLPWYTSSRRAACGLAALVPAGVERSAA